jgi:hypothetical protein
MAIIAGPHVRRDETFFLTTFRSSTLAGEGVHSSSYKVDGVMVSI